MYIIATVHSEYHLLYSSTATYIASEMLQYASNRYDPFWRPLRCSLQARGDGIQFKGSVTHCLCTNQKKGKDASNFQMNCVKESGTRLGYIQTCMVQNTCLWQQ